MPNRNLYSLALLCLILTACGGDYAKEGHEAFARGEFKVAERMLSVAVRDGNAPAASRFMWGASLARLKRVGEASAVLEPLMSDEQYGPRATLLCVEAAVNDARLDDVRRMVAAAATRWPNHPCTTMASFRLTEADYSGARRQFESMLMRYGGAPSVTKQEGRISRLLFAKETTPTEISLLQAIALECALTEASVIMPSLEAARTAAARMEASATAAATADPAAFEAIVRLIESAKHRVEPDLVLQQAVRILHLKPAEVSAEERRGFLEARRLEAAGHVTQAFETARRIPEAVVALEAAAPCFANPLILDEKLARLYYIAGDVEKLDVIAQRWLKADGRNLLASFYRGYVLFRLARYEEAANYLERARGLNSTTQAFNLMAAINFAKLGNHARAAPLFAMSAENGPLDAESIVGWADTMQALGDSTRARALLRDGMKVRFPNPLSEEHKKLQDTLLRYYKNAGHAIDNLEEARTLHREDRGNAYITLRLAQLELDGGDERTALQLCRDVQDDHPTLADGWRLGAETALLMKDNASTALMLERLNRLLPNDASVAWLQARAALAQKNTGRARHYAGIALERDPTTLGPALVLVQASLEDKRPREALEIGEELLKRAGESAGLLTLVGNAAQQLRLNDKAVDFLMRAEKAGANDSDFTLLLVRALVRSGRNAVAIPHAMRLTTDKNCPPFSRMALAEILIEAGAALEAATLAKDTLPTLPKGPELIAGLAIAARCHIAAGHWLDACTALVGLRRASDHSAAATLFIPAALKQRAYAEAAHCAEIALEEKALSQEVISDALRALMLTENWVSARRVAELCAKKNPAYQLPDLVLRARLLSHDGQHDQAAKLLELAFVNGNAAVKRDAVEALADSSIANDGDAAVAAQLVQWLRDAPDSVHLREQGARTALRARNYDEAAALLAEAAKLSKNRDDIVRLQARVELLRQRPREAAALLAPLGHERSRTLAALALALAESPTLKGSTGEYCAHLLQRRFAEAAACAAQLRDVPLTWRDPLSTLSLRLKAHPDETVLFMRHFTLALALMDEPMLANAGVNALDEARKVLESETKPLELWRALLRMQAGDGTAAARIAAPRLEADNPTLFELAIAARAAMLNAGPANMLKVLEGAGLNAAVPALLARELAELARSAGDHASAAALLSRLASPEDSDLASLALDLAVCAPDKVASVVLRIKEDSGVPRAARLLRATALARSGAPGEGIEALKRALAGKPVLDATELLFAVEAAAAAGDDLLAETLVHQALAAQPWKTAGMARCALLLRQYQCLPELQTALNDALSFIDQGGKLRKSKR